MLNYGAREKEQCKRLMENGIQWLVWFVGAINMSVEALEEVYIYGEEVLVNQPNVVKEQ